MAQQFNDYPYYDDFNENNKFYKILFKPGYAVQARELTQIQSILQKQIDFNGQHLFKDGAMVIPGQVSIDLNLYSAKIDPATLNLSTTLETISAKLSQDDATANSDASEFTSNDIIVRMSNTAGVSAQIIAVQSGATPVVLFKYISSSTDDNTTKEFASGDILTVSYEDGTTSEITLVADSAMGFGAAATIQKGVYFIRGSYVLVSKQTAILEDWLSAKPYITGKVGLKINESIVTADDDLNLLDKATGSPNYQAPGADRHYIDLVLTYVRQTVSDVLLNDPAESIPDFVELSTILRSEIQTLVKHTAYNEIEKTMARRTFDESGNYTVKEFGISIRENYNNNRGAWASGKSYIAGDVVKASNGQYYVCVKNIDGTVSSVEPSAVLSGNNFGISTDGGITWYNESKYTQFLSRGHLLPEYQGSRDRISIGLEAGKAYVNGYEIETLATKYVKTADDLGNILEGIARPLETDTEQDDVFTAIEPSYIKLDTSTIVGDIRVGDGWRVVLRKAGVNVGNAQALYITNGTTVSNLYLTDIRLNSGESIANITSVTKNNDGAVAETDFSANVYLESGKCALYNPTANPHLLKLSYAGISALKRTDNSYDMSYTVVKQYTGVVAGSSQLIITDTAFADEYVNAGVVRAIDQTDGANYVFDTANIAINTEGTQLTLTLPSPSLDGRSFSVLAAVRLVNLAPKTKTLTRGAKTIAITGTNKAAVAAVDIVRVNGIFVESTTGSGTFDIDVTSKFKFTNGRTSKIYGFSYITPLSSEFDGKSVKIVYENYSHGAGDYFAVDSYADSGVLFNSLSKISGTYESDYLDFRPIQISEAAGKIEVKGFTIVPLANTQVQATYDYFLPRNDIITLDADGNLEVKYGASALSPAFPTPDADSMTLYKLSWQPAARNLVDQVSVETIDNKRYTMRDIGKLDKRINNLEYYTTLSMIEQEVQSYQVYDEITGIPRVKNGFVVDTFIGHEIGNVDSAEYNIAVDPVQSQAAAYVVTEQLDVSERFSTDTARAANGYSLTGDALSLPYTQSEMIAQKLASDIVNINPFSVFTFIGDVKLTPDSDSWFETKQLPDIIVETAGNYDQVKRDAEKSGILGTKLNEVRTDWIGSPTLTSFDDRNIFGGPFSRRTVTTSTQSYRTITSDVTRTLQVSTKREVINEKEVSTTSVPYIRSRAVLFESHGLKPNTAFNAFFDGHAITEYVELPVRIRVTLSGATQFSSTKTVGTELVGTDSANNPARMVVIKDATKLEKEQIALTKGDVITFGGLTQTAVLAGVRRISSTVYELQLVNLKKFASVENAYLQSLLQGKTITGSLSGATAVIGTADTDVHAFSRIVSDESGSAYGLFKIPSVVGARFRTGTKEFKLIDTDTADSLAYSSMAATNYVAAGILHNTQASVKSIKTAKIVQSETNVRVSDIMTQSQVVSSVPYDPLAQTFYVQSTGGAFLTSIDVYFASKDANVPVKMEIREVVNGYPGSTILPMSQVMKKAVDVSVSNNGSVATTFTFDAPVYVSDKTWYAIVLMSDSNKYTTFVSTFADDKVDLITKNKITKQPNLGSLFKSQNASTWSAEQTQDLKFIVRKAQFATDTVSNIELKSLSPDIVSLDTNPFETLAGTTTVMVRQYNHGHVNGDAVYFDNVSGFTTVVNDYLNDETTAKTVIIDTDLINAGQDADYFKVAIPASVLATPFPSSISVGGDGIVSTNNIRFTRIQPVLEAMTFGQTSIAVDVIVKTQAGASKTFANISMDDAKDLFAEYTAKAAKDITLTIKMKSKNKNLSPIVDRSRLAVVLYRNKINNIGEHAQSAYLTRNISLVNECDTLRVLFDHNIPTQSDLKVYYKAQLVNTGDDNAVDDFNSKEWTELPMSYQKTNAAEFSLDELLDVSGLAFNTFAVKISFLSTNVAYTPTIRKLRVLAV